MLQRWVVPVTIVLAVACGHGTEPARPRGGSAQPETHGSGELAPSTTVNERDCDQLAQHAVAIRVAELRKTTPADQLPTEAEQAKLVAELRADPACLRLSPAALRCAIAATSLDALAACR
ncbi:MAG TPA: hypothetical protein VFQ53_31990 [Kofleriaceae bacterium]|nr:hypothetical protein [Kofleriaceae bacterium]